MSKKLNNLFKNWDEIKKEVTKVTFPLSNGSLLIMAGETQHYWKHQILPSKCLFQTG